MNSATSPQPFNLNYAPHFGMFENSAGEDLIDQIKFMHDQGFRALEDNWLKRKTPEEQEAIGKELDRLGMKMGVFVCYTAREPSLVTGKQEFVDDLVKQLEESVDVAKRSNATWMTLVPGHTEHRLDPDFQTANLIEALKRGAEIFEPHGLVMVMEPLNHMNHPNHFRAGRGPCVQHLQSRRQPRREGPQRPVPSANLHRQPDPQHGNGLGRNRLHPNRRQPRPKGAHDRGDQL